MKIEKKTAQISTSDRKLTALRTDLVKARSRWEKTIRWKKFDKYVLPLRSDEPVSPRELKRCIYFVRYQGNAEWITEMREEVEALEERIGSLNIGARRGGLALWLPKMMFDPVSIQLTTYYSRSVKRISLAEAQDFLRRASTEKALQPGSYVVISPARREHRIRAQYSHIKPGPLEAALKMPEWSVCFVQGTADSSVVERCRVESERSTEAPTQIAGRALRIIASHGQTFLAKMR